MEGKQQSIILGGAVVALLSTSYLGFINCLCCLGVVVGSMLAVWHYTETNGLTIKAGEGAVMGLVAALLGSVVAVVLNYVLMQMGIRHDVALLNAILDAFRESMPPEQYEDLAAQAEEPLRLGPYLFNSTLGVAVSGIFGAVGGAIGAALFKKGGEPEEDFGGSTI